MKKKIVIVDYNVATRTELVEFLAEYPVDVIQVQTLAELGKYKGDTAFWKSVYRVVVDPNMGSVNILSEDFQLFASGGRTSGIAALLEFGCPTDMSVSIYTENPVGMIDIVQEVFEKNTTINKGNNVNYFHVHLALDHLDYEEELRAGYHETDNEFGMPQTYDSSGKPVCSKCHGSVDVNKGQGDDCIACQDEELIEFYELIDSPTAPLPKWEEGPGPLAKEDWDQSPAIAD